MNDQSIPPGEGILHHAEGVDSSLPISNWRDWKWLL